MRWSATASMTRPSAAKSSPGGEVDQVVAHAVDMGGCGPDEEVVTLVGQARDDAAAVVGGA